MKNILVFFGGNSIEHEISIITGVLTLNSIDKSYNVIPIYVDKSGTFYTGKCLFDLDEYKSLDYKKLDKVTLISGSNLLYRIKGKRLKEICSIVCAINCMHGERGEDGSISALLSMCNIANASPEMAASSICMEKGLTKIALVGLGVPFLPYVSVKDSASSVLAENLGYPLVVKPNTGGSSIGISKVNCKRDLEFATAKALLYSKTAIIEPALEDFIEINCACFLDAEGNVITSECERPIGKDEVLTFSDKYQNGKREFPAKIESDLAERIKKTTSRIYRELGFKGVIRIDFFIKDDKIYVNEINTVPGSLAYYLFCKSTKEFTTMLNEMIEYAITSFNKYSLIKKEYVSGIITSLTPKGSKNIEK